MGWLFQATACSLALQGILTGNFVLADLFDAGFLILFLATLPAIFRRLPPIYAIYQAASWLLYLSRVSHMQPLLSTARYVLALFPAFIIFADLGSESMGQPGFPVYILDWAATALRSVCNMGLGGVKKAETFQPRWFVLLLLALFLLSAAWLRLYHLGFYSLWHDESFTWFFTRFPWSQMFAALRADGVHPPIYYLLEKILSGILGSNEGGLRIFSVAVDLVSVLLAIWLGWLCNGPLGGLVSGWFWAFNPFTVWYAQEARSYAFATMLSLAALVLFHKMKTNPSRSTMLITVFVLALGLLTHFFFFLVVGALILLALLQIRQSPAHFRNWTVLCLVVMIPLLLWMVWFFMQPKPMFSIGWITVPILADLPLTVWNFLSGYAGLFSVPSTLFGVITGLLLIVGLVAGESAKDNRQLSWPGSSFRSF